MSERKKEIFHSSMQVDFDLRTTYYDCEFCKHRIKSLTVMLNALVKPSSTPYLSDIVEESLTSSRDNASRCVVNRMVRRSKEVAEIFWWYGV